MDDDEDDFVTVSSKPFRRKKPVGKDVTNGISSSVGTGNGSRCTQDRVQKPVLESSNGDSGEVFIPDCPFCGKRTKGFEDKMCHVKSCGRKRGITADKQLAALRLQQKQVQERKDLGLPSQKIRPVKQSPPKNNTRVRIEGTEADLQTALALSASLQDAIDSGNLPANFPVADEVSLLPPDPRTSKSSGISKVNVRRRGNKHAVKVFPLMHSSLEERRSAVVEQVSNIMCEVVENSVPELLSEFYRYRAESRRMPELTAQARSPRLWKLNACATPKRDGGVPYQVAELEEFLSPAAVRTGRPRLRSLKELPGREDTVVMTNQNTTSLHLQQEETVESTQQILMNLCDMTPPTPSEPMDPARETRNVPTNDEDEEIVEISSSGDGSRLSNRFTPPQRRSSPGPNPSFSSSYPLAEEGLTRFHSNWKIFASDPSNHDAFFYSRDGETHGISSVVLKAQCPALLRAFRSKQVDNHTDVLGDSSAEAVREFFGLLHTGRVSKTCERRTKREVTEVCRKFACDLIHFESNAGELCSPEGSRSAARVSRLGDYEVVGSPPLDSSRGDVNFASSAPVLAETRPDVTSRRSERETRSLTPDLFEADEEGYVSTRAEGVGGGVSPASSSSVILIEEEPEEDVVNDDVAADDADRLDSGGNEDDTLEPDGEQNSSSSSAVALNHIDDADMYMSPLDFGSPERIGDETPTAPRTEESPPGSVAVPTPVAVVATGVQHPPASPVIAPSMAVASSSSTSAPVPISSQKVTPRGRSVRLLRENTPDFTAMLTPELQAKLNSMGVRKMSRNKSVKLLKYIHRQLNQAQRQQTIIAQEPPQLVSGSAATNSRRSLSQPDPSGDNRLSPIRDEDEPEAEDQEWCGAADAEAESDYELSTQQSQAGRGRKRIRKLNAEEALPAVKRFIQDRPALYSRILHYEPIPLLDLKNDLASCEITVEPPILQDVLDRLGVIFRIPRKDRNNRRPQADAAA